MRFIFGRNDDAEAGARDELLSRMDAFWKELSAVGLERLEPSAARRQVAERLAELHPAIDCEVLERTLVLTPRGERRLRPWVNALVARAPELGGLTVAGYGPPLSLSAALGRARVETGVDLAGSEVRAGFGRGHLLDLVFHSPEATSAADERVLTAAECCAEAVLGERVFDDWIGTVSVTPAPRRGPLRVVSDDEPRLPLAELGPSVRAAIEGVLSGLPAAEDGWTLFETEPPLASDYARQDDLAVATTCAPELLKCFLEGAPFSSKRFSRSGEVFAYLKLESKGASEERLAFRTEVEDALARELPPGLGRVIGNGLEVRYVYVDLALRDLGKALPILVAAARAHRADVRSWILFCDSDWSDEWVGVCDATPAPPRASVEHAP